MSVIWAMGIRLEAGTGQEITNGKILVDSPPTLMALSQQLTLQMREPANFQPNSRQKPSVTSLISLPK